MTLLPVKPCEEMTADDFALFWESFLKQLGNLGESWIRQHDSLLADDLLGMWQRTLEGLLARLGEFREIARIAEGQEMLCQIIWSIGAWDPSGPFGGIGGGMPGAFVSARMIKEAMERWLAPRLSEETRALLKALNQLLCMMRCL